MRLKVAIKVHENALYFTSTRSAQEHDLKNA